MNDWTDVTLGAVGGAGAPGQWLYWGAMVTGLMLALLVALQIVLAATARLPRASWLSSARRIATSALAVDARAAHRLLGRLIVGLVLLHPLLYLSAVTRRIGHWAPDKLYASFTDRSYYGDSLLLGLAGVAIVVALGMAAVRMRKLPAWHGWVRIGVLLGGYHALRIGSHVRDGVAGGLLWAGLALVALDGVARLGMGGRRWWQRRRQSAAADKTASDANKTSSVASDVVHEVRSGGLDIA